MSPVRTATVTGGVVVTVAILTAPAVIERTAPGPPPPPATHADAVEAVEALRAEVARLTERVEALRAAVEDAARVRPSGR